MRQLRSLLAPPVSVARDSEGKIQLSKLRLGNRFQSDVLRQVSIIGIVAVWTVSQLGSKFGAAAVLVTVPAAGLAAGAVTGIIIAKGKLQPFIVTLAMMVAVTGALRLIAGPTAAIYPIYSGTNAPADVDMLRGDLFGILPIQGVFFLLLVIIFGFLLKFTSFGCYVYAIGGNEQAARVAGIRVDAA
jgi:simple sugar transport system permease protein